MVKKTRAKADILDRNKEKKRMIIQRRKTVRVGFYTGNGPNCRKNVIVRGKNRTMWEVVNFCLNYEKSKGTRGYPDRYTYDSVQRTVGIYLDGGKERGNTLTCTVLQA